ncbi:hypothetical protein TBR22_A49770 [Luteitalea sp. TBR-22]|nr:hypothetical protein TBR22_A49770 [Luteitalea sp. TBR-22]
MLARTLPAAAVAVTLAACSTQPPQVDHATSVAAHRAEKDAMFREAQDSPVPKAEMDRFVPLAYYPIDPSYRTPASLARLPDAESPAFEMPTSTGQRRQMRKAGKLKFSLHGQTHELTAFISAEDVAAQRLFVPFRDLTAGLETYSSGRYLDLTRTPTGLYDLDFNMAYQPYCYYDARYDCPIPPAENRLSMPIRAGERMRKP